MGKVSESIFSCKTCVVPMAEVQHITKDQREKFKGSIEVIFKTTTWNDTDNCYNNSLYLRKDEAESFLRAWCDYRSELESDTLMDLP